MVIVQIPSVPTVDSTLAFTCSEDNQIVTSICGNDGRWNPDPEEFLCPTMSKFDKFAYRSSCISLTESPVTCPVPGSPSMGIMNTSGQSYIEGSQVISVQ